MSESLFSAYWYRVAKFKPALREAVVISRHVYRDEPWYVLRNRLNGSNYRFSKTAYAIIGQIDGCRTINEIWENVVQRSNDAPPTQDEVIRLLCRLSDADLIQSDILPSSVALARQVRGMPDNQWKKRVANPFSIRFPLGNPDRFLSKWKFLGDPFFTR